MKLNNGLRIKYLGHSTFLFTTVEGKSLIIDPWIETNPACPDQAKKIDALDVLLVTHGHSDHMQDAVPLAKKFKPQIACNFELSLWFGNQGVENVTGMNKGGSTTIEGLKVTMVNAFHSSSIAEGDSVIYGGEPCGYVVEFENGFKIYHAGDTCIFGDMELIGELYKPNLTFLPIGDLFTMGPEEAARACRLLDAKHVIPMHYGTFPPLTGTPERLKKLTEDFGVEVIALKPGETLD